MPFTIAKYFGFYLRILSDSKLMLVGGTKKRTQPKNL